MRSEIESHDVDVDDLALLERGPLFAFAYLLTGDRAIAASLTYAALAQPLGELGEYRAASVFRARVAHRARKRSPSSDGSPVMDGLAACDARERIVLVCSVYERLSDAEIASIAGCRVEEVEQLRARATAAAARSMDVSGAAASGVLRMALLDAAGRAGDLPSHVPAHRDARRHFAAAAVIVGLAVIAGVVAVTSARTPSPVTPVVDVFEQPRLGYRLTIPRGWRSVPTVAEGIAAGVDPARLGLATMDPDDETAVFIPQRAQDRPAMVRIVVTRSDSFDADVAAARDQAADAQRTDNAVVTAATDTVAGRPAMRLRIEHPADGSECAGCRRLSWVVHWVAGTTMRIELTIFGSDEQLFAQGWTLVRSIASRDAAIRYLPEHGTVTDAIQSDEHLDTLLRFLDARARGAGDELLADDARIRSSRIASYDVTERVASADGSTFVVSLTTTDGLGQHPRRTAERIVIGPGIRYGVAWPSLVLGITEVAVS